MKNTYKGIVFADGYNKPFAEFKTEMEHNHVFRKIPSAEREKALKEAHKIATHGNSTGTTDKIKEATAKED